MEYQVAMGNLDENCWVVQETLNKQPDIHVCDVNLSLFAHRANQGRIFIFSQEGWKNFRWGASHMQYAIFDALEEA